MILNALLPTGKKWQNNFCKYLGNKQNEFNKQLYNKTWLGSKISECSV